MFLQRYITTVPVSIGIDVDDVPSDVAAALSGVGYVIVDGGMTR